MATDFLRMDRRELMAGFGAASLGLILPGRSAAQGPQPVSLQLRRDTLNIRPGGPETPICMLSAPELHFRRGESPQIEIASELALSTAFHWRGIDGTPAIEPLVGRPPLAPGGRESLPISTRHAGTFLCDLSLLADPKALPARAMPLIVAESEAIGVDYDATLLVEEWRLRADATARLPGADDNETAIFYTLNGKPSFDVLARTNDRLRLRFINGSPRTVIALKLESVDVTVMAIDGEPAEPFPARNGALVLAPGGRVDTFVDVAAPGGSNLKILLHDGKQTRTIGFIIVPRDPPTRAAPLPPPGSLPSNGLPPRLDLKNALRVELALNGPDWIAPASFAVTSQPAFRSKTGRVAVLALANRAATTTVFHLHGHHFRLLDRLDDGWKPFWLDTLAIEPGQTQRVAFLAEHAGRYLIESVAADWAKPRFVRWYAVE